jgi:predicted RNA-binding protein with PIN domain
MAKHYYIDGYNVIYHSSALRSVIQRDLERARELLIDRVAQFCITTATETHLVFDGRGRSRADKIPHHRHVDHLHVIYTPLEKTADAWIEREVYKHHDRMQVCVVTNDRGIRDLCRGMGALTMDSENFLSTVHESHTDVREVIQRKGQNDAAFVEDRLSGASLDILRKLRDKL